MARLTHIHIHILFLTIPLPVVQGSRIRSGIECGDVISGVGRDDWRLVVDGENNGVGGTKEQRVMASWLAKTCAPKRRACATSAVVEVDSSPSFASGVALRPAACPGS